MKSFILSLSLIFIIVSCKITHNTPTDYNTPNSIVPPNTTRIFVDQNGNFYPNYWDYKFGSPPENARKWAYSLNTIAKRDTLENLEDYLLNFEYNFLQDLKEHLVTKNKVYVLVHGYNNDESSALKSYSKIEEIIDIQKDDEVIEFYWDGLESSSTLGGLKIWFNAAGYSQLSGEFGLRKVLNTIENKDIIIISHSRGASVLLSSLSDPPYKPEFIDDTKKNHYIEIGSNVPLAENNNRINCIMLAPAVGLVDFRTPEYNNDENSFRNFSNQVKNMHISINGTDATLKKFIGKGNLSGKFNPTDLGYRKDVFNELSEHYEMLNYTDFTGLYSHAFLDYVNDEKFKLILKGLDIPLVE